MLEEGRAAFAVDESSTVEIAESRRAMKTKRGFDTYQENKGPNTMEPKGQVDVTFRAAEEWLRSHRDERYEP